MKSEIRQNGFKFGWKRLVSKPTIMDDGFYVMRLWQEKAFNQLKDLTYSIINAPMGSGKSKLMCWLSAYKMKKNPLLRTIIAVPQTSIGDGFLEENLLMPDGEKLHWMAQHNLCKSGGDEGEGTANYVIQWLANPHGFFNDRILVCTHATIVAVYKKLKDENRLNLFKNLLLWVDEAHHSKNTELESIAGAVISNGLGELVMYLLGKASVQIGLATASFFRGDRLTILTEEMQKKFSRFDLPTDEYLEQMEHLESFSFDFLLCGKDFTKAIETLAKHRKGKDIVYIPHPISRDSTGDKYNEVKNILNKYNKVHGGKIVQKDALTLLKSKDNEFKIIDLVEDRSSRDNKKEYIRNIKAKNDLDAIITLGMFKEGSNWIWADRGIIIGARASLLDVFQMIGRVFRDAEGKIHVEIIQVLPFSLDQQNEAEFRDNLNNYLKAIYASLILENIFHPVKIKMKDEDDGNGGTKKKPTDYLGSVISDESKRLSLIEEVSNKLLEIVDTNKQAGDVVILWDEYSKILPNILASYGIKGDFEDIGKQIWGMFARQTLRMQGINVDDIPFDILQKTSPLDFLLRYTSGSCNIDTFRHLRTAIHGRNFMSFEELKNHIADMKAKGQVLNGSGEFGIWRQNNCDYNAVLIYRSQHKGQGRKINAIK